MKILFLDIDGVLVNRRSLRERSGMQAVGDPVCVAALNRIIEATGAALVISSSWRFCGLEEMRLILKHWGVSAYVLGITPDLTRRAPSGVYSGVPRALEIQQWLSDNDRHQWLTDHNQRIESFVILDDDPDADHMGRLVRTVFEAGLTESDADRAIVILRQVVASTELAQVIAAPSKAPDAEAADQRQGRLMKIIQSLRCLLMLAGIALLGGGTFAFIRIGILATDLSQTALDASTTILEARATVEALRTDAHEAISRALDQVVGMRVDAMTEIHSIRQTEIPYILGSADSKLDRALLLAMLSGERLDGQLAALNRNIAAVLDPVAATARRVEEAAPLFLDCDHNPDCAFNRFQGTTKAIERSAQNFGQMSTEIRMALPPALASFQATARTVELGFPRIVTNAGGIAENVNRLTRPRWYDEFLKVGVSGAAAYGALK